MSAYMEEFICPKCHKKSMVMMRLVGELVACKHCRYPSINPMTWIFLKKDYDMLLIAAGHPQENGSFPSLAGISPESARTKLLEDLGTETTEDGVRDYSVYQQAIRISEGYAA